MHDIIIILVSIIFQMIVTLTPFLIVRVTSTIDTSLSIIDDHKYPLIIDILSCTVHT